MLISYPSWATMPSRRTCLGTTSQKPEGCRYEIWHLHPRLKACRGQVQSESSLQIAALDCQPPSSTHLIQSDCTMRQASSRM